MSIGAVRPLASPPSVATGVRSEVPPVWRWLIQTALSLLLLAALAVATLLVAALAPGLAGYRSVPVTTAAYEPYIADGSVMVQQPTLPADLPVGATISFSSDRYGDRVFTHELVAVNPMQGVVELRTRPLGDQAEYTWLVAPNQPVGKLVYVVPRAGQVVALLGSPQASLIPTAIGGLLLWWTLRRSTAAGQPRSDSPMAGSG